MESTASHYGNWIGVFVWIIIYGVFLLFMPFYRKSQRKPTTAYFAFIVAYALEMFGVPLSMYFVTWAFGHSLPDGFLWGHTLHPYIGNWGMYLCIIFTIIGGLSIIWGWREIYHKYWKHSDGKGKLVTSGVYRYVRHPQYTGFMLISLGMIFEWATISLLIMWPILVIIYYRLARREEQNMINEFGEQYVNYMKRTAMFLPNPFRRLGT